MPAPNTDIKDSIKEVPGDRPGRDSRPVLRKDARSGKDKAEKRKLPPGQRLLRYAALALCIVCSMCIYIPAGTNVPGKEKPSAIQMPQLAPPFDMNEVLEGLQLRMKLMSDKPNLHLGAFAIEPSSGRYVSVDGDKSFAAASMIKVPVLVKLLDAIDRGDVDPGETLVLRQDLIGGGSGYLQWRPVGSKVSLKEAMESMIIFSDNTATNLIIDRVGGKDVCNRDFVYWGLKRTYINNWLPDLEGTNKTSPFDLVQILAKVDKGDLLSTEGRKRMLAVMERTRIKTLLPFGLPPGAKISHKTGDIGSLVGDCGIITSPDGKRFIACIQVARPHNDRRANELIRQVAKVLYTGIVSNSESMISTKKSTLR
ncbi:MAG: class A beta-lactamase-related serine hydrolase [Candidatus Obscuribacterales bacterium]|nr:class A beta-lactamase-related serine hydrolase [Candidatus Obscuribacterales bacterium]